MKMDAVSRKQRDFWPNKTHYALAASTIFAVVSAILLAAPVTSVNSEVTAAGVFSCFAGLFVVGLIWLLVWAQGKKRQREDTRQQQQQQQQQGSAKQQKQGSKEREGEVRDGGNSDATGSNGGGVCGQSTSTASHKQRTCHTLYEIALRMMSEIKQCTEEDLGNIRRSCSADGASLSLRNQDKFRQIFMKPLLEELFPSSVSAGATAGGRHVAHSNPPNPFSSVHLPSCAHTFNTEVAGFCFAAQPTKKCVVCQELNQSCKKLNQSCEKKKNGCLVVHSHHCGCNESIKNYCSENDSVFVVCPRQVLQVSEHMLPLRLYFHATF